MTAAHLILLGLIPPAYLLGSVPFGLLIARTRGIDPREAGSGNIGATNVGRLLGARFFALVFIFDMLKGMLPMLAAGTVLARSGRPSAGFGAGDYGLWLLAGFAAIFGHMFSIFIGFKGGKGVATSAGVVLGLFPYYTAPGLVAIVVFLVLFKLTRYVSVASVTAANSFAATYVIVALVRGWPLLGAQWPLLLFAVLIATLITYKHRANIARLRAGTESRIGASPSQPPCDAPSLQP